MIRAQNLGRSFLLEGNPSSLLPVLKNVSFEIPEGQCVALLGPSGSGKSTLLALLAGLDSPTEGAVSLNGTRLDSLNSDELTEFRAKNLGFVFQAYHLIPTLTALENVMLPLELQNLPRVECRNRAEAWLKRVGLDTRMNHLPRQLSGGEQQRVAVARALVAEPRIVFADEPTGNLDSVNAAKVTELLLSLRGRCALVLVTHDAALAGQADRVLRLRDGEVESDTLPKSAGARP